jgi:hypothetical protein
MPSLRVGFAVLVLKKRRREKKERPENASFIIRKAWAARFLPDLCPAEERRDGCIQNMRMVD